MNIKKANRKCMVRGCKETKEVYAIALTRELGNSVLICPRCAKMAADAIKAITQEDIPQDGLKCQYCGRVCGSQIGLVKHEQACKNKQK
jgi:uncharacterized C2H2 Zn-finger protein